MPRSFRVPNFTLTRDSQPQRRTTALPISDLTTHIADYTPEPLIVRDIRAKRPPPPDRPWTNTVRPPADDLD